MNICSRLSEIEFLKYIESNRSIYWSKTRNEYIKHYPVCEICVREAKVVHHIIPVHIHSGLELSWSNLISLCDNCHFKYGHLENWKSWNPLLTIDQLLIRYDLSYNNLRWIQEKEFRPYTDQDAEKFMDKFLCRT